MGASSFPGKPVFRKIRIAILLYVLLVIAAVQLLTAIDATDWNEPLWVEVRLIAGDGADGTQRYIDRLEADAFDDIERFLAAESARYGVTLGRPFRIELAGQLDRALPALPAQYSWLGTIRWSLAMRWFTTRLHWRSDRPTPDITLFARYHAPGQDIVLDRSTALSKGMIAIANVFADPAMRGANSIVIAHELLHTLGATDKYDLATNQPVVPTGLAAPDRRPLYPQPAAELMAGRIATGPLEAEMPSGLADVVIGPATAYEIGWLDELPPATASFAAIR